MCLTTPWDLGLQFLHSGRNCASGSESWWSQAKIFKKALVIFGTLSTPDNPAKIGSAQARGRRGKQTSRELHADSCVD